MGHKQVPFKALMGDPESMLDIKYLPRPNILHDPCNMPKEDLIDLLEHIHIQQQTFGAGDAFQFSHYQTGNKELKEARYPNDLVQDNRDVRRPKKRPRRRKAKKPPARRTMPVAKTRMVEAGNHPNDPDSPSRMDLGATGPTVALEQSSNTDAPFVSIDLRQMNLLAKAGVTGLGHANGPNEGNPVYSLPSSLLPMLHELEQQMDQNIDPSLIGVTYASAAPISENADHAENLADFQQVTGHAAAGTVGSRTSGTERRLRDLSVPAGHSIQATKLPEGKIGHTTNLLCQGQAVTNQTATPIDRSAKPSHAGTSDLTGAQKRPAIEDKGDGPKRKRTRTADDLAQEEAAMIGISGRRRRPPNHNRIWS